MNFGVEIPFVSHLGFELVLFEGGHSQIDYLPQPEHLNSFQVTHGGALMTLLDVVMATAARSADRRSPRRRPLGRRRAAGRARQ